eukprot:9500605-Pyramimonas_sp.AAC.2
MSSSTRLEMLELRDQVANGEIKSHGNATQEIVSCSDVCLTVGASLADSEHLECVQEVPIRKFSSDDRRTKH